MIKKFIEPLQKVLVQKKKCPACTRPLNKAKTIKTMPNESILVECECNRLFVFDKANDMYRRALQEEV